MENKILEKIVKFFKKIECPAELVFKKNSNNDSLQKYAVIYTKEDIMLCDKKEKKFEFEEKWNLDITAFYGKYFNKERLLKRLEQEGYLLCDIKERKI